MKIQKGGGVQGTIYYVFEIDCLSSRIKQDSSQKFSTWKDFRFKAKISFYPQRIRLNVMGWGENEFCSFASEKPTQNLSLLLCLQPF